MLCEYVLLQTCGSFIFLIAVVTFDFTWKQVTDILIGLIYGGLPFISFELEGILQDIMKEPDRSLRPSNQLGALKLNKFCGYVRVDRNCTNHIPKHTVVKIKEVCEVNKKIVAVKANSTVSAMDLHIPYSHRGGVIRGHLG